MNFNLLSAHYFCGTKFPCDVNRLHMHTFTEISVVKQGDIKYISDTVTDRINGKCIIFSKAYQLHNPFINKDKMYERYQISLEHIIIADMKILENVDSFMFALSDEDFDELFSYMSVLCRDFSVALTLKDELVFKAMLYKIREIYFEKKKKLVTLTSTYIDDVIAFITENYNKKITIDALSEKFFVSRNKLIKDFSKYTGMSINKYINMTKIGCAKKLLESGESITKTAEICGFSSSNYFIKSFSKTNGITPHNYKKLPK